ncbi:hypothetical protein Tco_0545417 [Tanacetum coccineum]
MLSKPANNMASNAEKTQSQGNLHSISEATLSSSELYLDELTHGVTGTIIVMICRSWDVHTITGCYISTDFVMSNAKMLLDMLQMSAESLSRKAAPEPLTSP